MLQMVDSPESDASIAAAKDAQEAERATAIAVLLANFSGYQNLALESEHIRQHFAQWGLTAVRGSAFTGNPFRYCALANHAAAQAASDLCASLEQYVAVDLLSPTHARERMWWSQITSRAIQSYLNVLGGKTTDVAHALYSDRLKLVKG